MTQLERRLVLSLSLAAFACGGLDPQSFGPPAPRGTAGQAGYSFDAGTPMTGGAGSGGGSAGRATVPPGGSGGARAMGQGGEAAQEHGGAAADVDGGEASGPSASSGNGGADGAGAAGGSGGTTGGDAGAAGGSGGTTGGGVPSGGSSGAGGAGSASGGSASGSSPEGAGAGGEDRGGAGGQGGAVNGGTPGASGAGNAGGAGGNAGGAGGNAGGGEPEDPPVLSEYVEGSGSYKALELRASPNTVLDGCRLVTYSNGSDTGSGLALAGVVSTLGVYTLCSSSLSVLIGAACDRTTNLSFNGNDAIVLECHGAVVDSLGQVAFDPGTAWNGATGSTANATLRRRCGEGADLDPTDVFDPDAGWLAHPTDTFAGLGDPTCG